MKWKWSALGDPGSSPHWLSPSNPIFWWWSRQFRWQKWDHPDGIERMSEQELLTHEATRIKQEEQDMMRLREEGMPHDDERHQCEVKSTPTPRLVRLHGHFFPALLERKYSTGSMPLLTANHSAKHSIWTLIEFQTEPLSEMSLPATKNTAHTLSNTVLA